LLQPRINFVDHAAFGYYYLL